MKIVFVLTYPIYHDGWTTSAWLDLENQNRWIPGVLAEMGHEVEFWGGDADTSTHSSHMAGFPDYPIRLFRTEATGRRSKFHRSEALIAHARAHPADLYLLKGVDGGLGTQLLRTFLLPGQHPFTLVLGGQYRSPYAPQAEAVLYETEYQREQLERPGWWRAPVPARKLIRLPKSVDTDHFAPGPSVEKRFDVLSISRLDRRNKSFEELGRLSASLSVAVVGGGPDEALLQRQYPAVEWLGRQPNHTVPTWMKQARVFLHNGVKERRPTRDFYPRVIAEALACGVPVVAFSDLITPDVLPDGCGIRVSRNHYREEIQALVTDPARLERMREAARDYATSWLGKRSSARALRALLERSAESPSRR